MENTELLNRYEEELGSGIIKTPEEFISSLNNTCEVDVETSNDLHALYWFFITSRKYFTLPEGYKERMKKRLESLIEREKAKRLFIEKLLKRLLN